MWINIRDFWVKFCLNNIDKVNGKVLENVFLYRKINEMFREIRK